MTEIRRLDTLSRNALENLQRVFPYGVRYANGTFRSWFCTEKPHFMTHWADNYAAVGRTRIISTSRAEARMKTAVKVPSRKTVGQQPGLVRPGRQPPQEQHGGEGGDGAAATWHLDESGMHQVYTIYVGGILGFAPGLPKFAF